jgi:hypothetical protein
MTRALFLLAFLAGCSSGMPDGTGLGGDPSQAAQDHDPDAPFLSGLATGTAQLDSLCGRGHQDLVAQGICAKPTPSVTSLAELQHVVGLFSSPQPPQFALIANSTSALVRSVSAINPRAIVFTPPSAAPTTQQNDGSFVQDPGFVALGFARGGQLVEVVAHDPQRDELNFYLVKFTQACTSTGCTPGDLFTGAVEKDWKTVTVYDDEDLKNTVFDCRACHQPNGPGTRKMLRMQERRAPWTHWMRNNLNEPGGMALLSDYQAAHGDEDYAGIPGNLLDTPRSDPLVLEALVDNNSISPQPNEFNGSKIEQQVAQQGVSSTWQQLYQNFLSGDVIPPPYQTVRITDDTKLQAMTNAYAQVRLGQAPASSLPNIADVFADDALQGLGVHPAPSSDGQGILVQMCQRCHNGTLDSSLPRARFDVTKLSSMSRAEKDLAITRLETSKTSSQLMPPTRFGELTDAQIQLAVQELQK